MSSEEKEDKRITRREFVRGAAVVGAAGVLASCGPTPAPQVVKETVEVPVEVTKIVEVAGEVPAVTAGEAVYEVVTPRGEPTVEKVPIAPRLDTLAGKTICMYGTSFRSPITNPWLEEWIKERYSDVETFYEGQPEDYVARYQELGCDAVIIGNGG
jgi:hypothetical protein